MEPFAAEKTVFKKKLGDMILESMENGRSVFSKHFIFNYMRNLTREELANFTKEMEKVRKRLREEDMPLQERLDEHLDDMPLAKKAKYIKKKSQSKIPANVLVKPGSFKSIPGLPPPPCAFKSPSAAGFSGLY